MQNEENNEIILEPKELEERIDDTEVVEFEFNEDGEEDLKKTLKKLRADLKEAKSQKEEYLTGWQKERAAFVNYRKEESDRNNEIRKIIQTDILEEFIKISDSFDMAFSNKESWEKVDENWRKGIEYIYSQLNSTFESYGVVSFGKEGDTFDPALHEPTENIETKEEDKDHKIAQVIQQGYKMGEKIIRPARVKVYQYK